MIRQSLPVQENDSMSKKWGSYFADCIAGAKSSQDTPNLTWCCSSIRNYSTIAIPSIAAIVETWRKFLRYRYTKRFTNNHDQRYDLAVIVDLPLDFKFTRFSGSNTDIDGYFPPASRNPLISEF
ncbi:unnamed protein product [Ranitomeya imitator]|uniref:Uncharacterized protein n=1 Tax=Ranitomeya imitator TaxID=111125 RepID=A0ABN9LR52_9NEOB|nr:unnamed protein product [Ranitomeya imitator]